MANLAIAGKRYRFGTGVVIDPRLWNAGKQTIKTSDPNYNAHSKRLQTISTYVQRAYNELHPSGKDKLLSRSDIETLVQRIRAFIAPDSGHASKTENTFSGRFQEFIDTYTIRTRSGQITHRRPGATSLSLYARTLRYLKEWSAAKRVALTFESIDETMYRSFCSWLGKEKGHADTSVSNIIKVLKIFMRWSRQKGYHSTSTWELFWRDRRTGDTIALNVDELRRLRDLDLTENPRLARIRDVFLLQAYTGLRYGDLQLLQPKHFDDEAGIIRYTTTKNHTQCIIPITKPLQQLLQNHPTRSFDFPSNVKANLYLKELGKVAGLDKITTVAHYRGGERTEESKPRSELLTTHVARRTFSTTSVRFGVPESVISIVTGHTAKGMLQQHYILFDEEAVRDIVCKAWEQL
ncbi:MAG: tyrosine-type recombinase/integrase [Bacteroidetes bacterium]|nr:tyrosine-type recombinase/integrase [Bacteroidota bacterium]